MFVYKPTNQADFVTYVQDQLDNRCVAMLDPETSINITTPVTFTLGDSGGHLMGLKANGAKFSWAGGLSSVDMITFEADVSCRNLIIEGLSLYGAGYEGTQCDNGLVFKAPKDKAIYKAVIRDCVSAYFGAAGIVCKGDFYESLIINAQCENNLGDGLIIANGGDGGIASNVMVVAPNLSRNLGYGLKLTSAHSVDVNLGSFIVNKLGGIYASNGIRYVNGVNFENSGLTGIIVPTSDYITTVRDCHASSDGTTTAPGGTAMRYLIDYDGAAGKIQHSGLYVTYYGGGTDNMAVWKP